MTTLRLDGARPEPLGAYLKALAALRIVGEQFDACATGWWEDDVFVLQSSLTKDDLIERLLQEWRPTPILSPWNGSSGFGKEGAAGLARIEASDSPRFAAYRAAIAVARDLLARADAEQWPKNERKERLLVECRNRFPDEAVRWLDTAVLLTAQSGEVGLRPVYPLIVGTGGNFGRLDLGRNFTDHLALLLLDDTPPQRSRRRSLEPRAALLESLFGGTGTPLLKGASAGQYDVGATGGTNAFGDDSDRQVLNPWDFVLTLEGAICFSGAPARRLGTSRGTATAPFTTQVTPAGFASTAPGEDAKGELWTPLWTRPTTAGELRKLFSEGRGDWRGGYARTGLDFARACSSLGVDRGLGSFVRYVVAIREGKSPVAVPAGRVSVRSAQDVPPLQALDPWLERVRDSIRSHPSGVAQALRLLEQAMFDAAVHGQRGARKPLFSVLVAAAGLDAALAQASSLRTDRQIPPLQGLSASVWAPHLLRELDSPELRLALALSSLHEINPATRVLDSSLATLLRPVIAGPPSGRLEWRKSAAPLVPGLGFRAVTPLLAAVLERRTLDVLGQQRPLRLTGSNAEPAAGLPVGFPLGIPAPLADVARLVRTELDERRLAEALRACLLLDWREPDALRLHLDGSDDAIGYVPAAFTLIAPFFCRQPPSGPTRYRTAPLFPEASWAALLARDRLAVVEERAILRLRLAGLSPVLHRPLRHRGREGPSGARLAACVLCPMSPSARDALLARSCPPPALVPP